MIEISKKAITIEEKDVIDFLGGDILLFIKEKYFRVIKNKAFFKDEYIFKLKGIPLEMSLVQIMEVDYEVPKNRFTGDKNLIIRCRLFNLEEKYKNIAFQKKDNLIIVHDIE